MLIADVPYVPVHDTPIVLAQAATLISGGTPAGSIQSPDYMLTACQEMPGMSEPTSAERIIDPAGYVAGLYYEHFKLEPDPSSVSITLLVSPSHGKIVLVTDNVLWPGYRYDAEPGYAGKDQVTFMAKYHGKTYKVIVNLEVSAVGSIPTNPTIGPGVCPPQSSSRSKNQSLVHQAIT